MEMSQEIGPWSDVDGTGQAAHFVAYLDTVGGTAWIGALKQRTYHLLEPREGMRLLDVGCGTGDDVRALAALVAPGGEAVGIDRSAAMIAEAHRRAATGLPVAFHVGDAHALPFPSDGTA